MNREPKTFKEFILSNAKEFPKQFKRESSPLNCFCPLLARMKLEVLEKWAQHYYDPMINPEYNPQVQSYFNAIADIYSGNDLKRIRGLERLKGILDDIDYGDFINFLADPKDAWWFFKDCKAYSIPKKENQKFFNGELKISVIVAKKENLGELIKDRGMKEIKPETGKIKKQPRYCNPLDRLAIALEAGKPNAEKDLKTYLSNKEPIDRPRIIETHRILKRQRVKTKLLISGLSHSTYYRLNNP